MGRPSISSALASIGKQFNPKVKSSRDGGKSFRRKLRRGGSYDSSSMSDSRSGYSHSCSESYSSSSESSTSPSRNRRKTKERRHRHRSDKKRSKDKRRRSHRKSSSSESPCREQDSFHSSRLADASSARQFGSSRQRYFYIQPNVAHQMVDLLMRMLPFYGQGDPESDSVVVSTIHRLPPLALEITDEDGNTCLLVACQVGAFDLFPILLSKGCNVNARNNLGVSSLHFACYIDTFSPDAAIELIRHGAMAEVVENEFGCTPLHWAAWAGHAALCRVLCNAGASPKTIDKNGFDPIAYSKQNAAQTGNTACTELLESFCGVGKSDVIMANQINPPPNQSEWVRLLDSNTGSSFYHNKESGESLWGDDYRDSVCVKPSISTEVSVENGKTPHLYAENCCGEESDKIESSPTTEKTSCCGHERKNVQVSMHENYLDIIDELSVQSSISSEDVEINAGTRVDSEEETTSKNTRLTEINFATAKTKSPDKKSETQNGMKNRREHRNHETKCILDEFGSSSDEDGMKETCSDNMKRLTSAEGTTSGDCNASNALVANRNSFEERMSNLQQKMESQLMTRLQNIEEKISQQKSDVSSKSEDDVLELKANLLEMTDATMKLRTDAATKDLEILSLKQKLIRLETDIESLSAKPVFEPKVCSDIGVGDGDLEGIGNSEACDDDNELVEKTLNELAETRQEIVQLHEKTRKLTEELHVATKNREETLLLLSTAEQRVIEERSSRDELVLLLEKAREGKEVDAALAQSFQEEKRRSEEENRQLNEQLSDLDTKWKHKTGLLRKEIVRLEEKILAEEMLTEKQLKEHQNEVAAIRSCHKEELRKMKSELSENHQIELRRLNDLLKEEKLTKIEMEVAKNDAVDEMERAVDKARAAEAKLKEMTDFVNNAEELKKSNDLLHTALLEETEKRKILHNTVEDMKGRIRVYVRVRPLSTKEIDAKFANILVKEDDRTCVMKGDDDSGAETRDWEFDKIFCGSDADGNSQDAIFKDASDLITSAIDGFNVCIFAYGQTGSGKTYTMFGPDDPTNETQMGLAPRVAQEIFKKLQERSSSNDIEVTVSMLELYNDKLQDLLVSKKTPAEGYSELKIRLAEHTSTGLVEVEGAKIKSATNSRELLDIFHRGSQGRTSSSTKMNAESSRSHMITSVVISLTNRRTGKSVHGKLTLVDLAGSERVSKSGADGHQLKEAQSINKSLSALGDVIGALTTGGRQHIPYRNHPLTMLMSDSIGGNAKTLMFLCCSPAEYNRKETTNSLDFAKRCRNVTNNVAKGGSSASQVNQLRALKKELSKITKVKGKPAKRPIGLTRRPGIQ